MDEDVIGIILGDEVARLVGNGFVFEPLDGDGHELSGMLEGGVVAVVQDQHCGTLKWMLHEQGLGMLCPLLDVMPRISIPQRPKPEEREMINALSRVLIVGRGGTMVATVRDGRAPYWRPLEGKMLFQ